MSHRARLLSYLFLLALAALWKAVPLVAQPAQPMSIPYLIPAIWDGAIDFGDMDGDGDLDLALTGRNERELVIRVERLMDIPQFTPDGLPIPSAKDYVEVTFRGQPAVHGDIAWGDYDLDGDGDLLVTGLTRFFQGGIEVEMPILHVHMNGGEPSANGTWFDSRLGLEGLYRSTAEWADLDGDGDLDIVASGLPALDATVPITRVYMNTGAGFVLTPTNLPAVISGDLSVADLDGDGLDDVAMMGDSGNGVFFAGVYRNTGSGFAATAAALPSLSFGSVDWGDFDGDGDPDLLITGGRLDPRFLNGVTEVFRNDGGTLSRLPLDLEGWTLGEARWGDADRDGDLDLYVIGSPFPLEASVLRVFAYDGFTFSPIWQLTGTRFAGLAVGDFNNDGDADIALTGDLSGAPRFRFYSNRVYPECLKPEWVPEGQSRGDCAPI